MPYALEEKKTPAQPTVEPAPDAERRTEGPLTAADADAAKQEKEKEKERAAAVQAKWEGLLGKWLGGQLAPLVLEHVSVDALNGYVKQGLDAAGPALGKVLKDQTKPGKDQEKALKEYSDALAGVMTGLVDKWVASEGGQKVLGAISGWVQDHPGWVMGIVGSAVIGGAVAAWFANADVPNIEVPLKLGKGWEMKAGLDLGTIQQLGFQGASLVVANKNAKITTKAEVTKKEEEKDGEVVATTHAGSLTVKQGDKDKESLTFVVNGSIKETKDGLVAHTMGGSLKLVDPDTGVTVTVGADGKWDSTGASENSFSYNMQSGKDSPVSGSLGFGGKTVTLVDKDGNIVNVSSAELKVAVGDKANKFEASVKTEDKDGANTTTVGVGGKAQLGSGTLFQGNANVAIGEGDVVVKLNGKMEATIGGKKVAFEGNYETDGKITGKIKLGDGEQYKEIIGEKSGDTVVFKTRDVFKNHAITQYSGDEQGVGYEGTNLGGTGLGLAAKQTDKETSASAKYSKDWLKAHLDYTMKDGKETFGAGASVNTESGYVASADLKIGDERVQELSLKLGFRDPKEFKTFLVGYKREWIANNEQYADKFDLTLEYALGNWSTRLQGGVDLMGNQVSKTKLDLGLGYKLDKDWSLIGGVQMNGMRNQDTNAFDTGYKPYIGAQYGNIGVAAFYDSQNKGGGLMLTIPLGRR